MVLVFFCKVSDTEFIKYLNLKEQLKLMTCFET